MSIEWNEIIEEGSWRRAASAKLFTCFARLNLSTLHLFVNPATIHQLAPSENLPFFSFFFLLFNFFSSSSSFFLAVTRTSQPSNSIFAALVHRFICNLHHLPSIHSVTDTTTIAATSFFLLWVHFNQLIPQLHFQFQICLE